MINRRVHRRIRGHLVELDLYAPSLSLSAQGITLHADTLLIARRNYRDWRWVVGVRVMGFGLAVSAPK